MRPSREILRQHFNYDPDTGVFWLKNPVRGDGTGYVDDLGYRRFYFKGSYFRAHQLIWCYIYDQWILVDHVDGDKLNNKLSNLRPATKAQNAMNAKVRRDNISGYKGVFKAGLVWRAAIYVEGKAVSLGRFPTPAEAGAAYERAAREFFGDFARVS